MSTEGGKRCPILIWVMAYHQNGSYLMWMVIRPEAHSEE